MNFMKSHAACVWGLLLATMLVHGNRLPAPGHVLPHGRAYTLKATSGAFFFTQPKNHDSRKIVAARFWPKASYGVGIAVDATLGLLTRSASMYICWKLPCSIGMP